MFGKRTAIIAQEIFRTVMNSFSSPGKTFDLSDIKKRHLDKKTSPEVFYALCYALMDNETAYSVIGKDVSDDMVENIYKYTKSKYVSVDRSDFVIITGYSSIKSIQNINRGTILFPDRGATVIYFVKKLDGESGKFLTLTGPGIKDDRSFHVDGIDIEDIKAISESNGEFPLGIDVVFFDGDDRIVAIPRSSKITIGE
jgi:alpha-D-ribose 1-methylphosphonate 5-triphosphate synthase subunit PhnH